MAERLINRHPSKQGSLRQRIILYKYYLNIYPLITNPQIMKTQTLLCRDVHQLQTSYHDLGLYTNQTKTKKKQASIAWITMKLAGCGGQVANKSKDHYSTQETQRSTDCSVVMAVCVYRTFAWSNIRLLPCKPTVA